MVCMDFLGLALLLYLSTSLSLSSGMYFCRILTCAPMKIPLYISPIPYVMFFSTSLWRPLQNKKTKIKFSLNNYTGIRWFQNLCLFLKLQFQDTWKKIRADKIPHSTWMRVHLQSLERWSRTLCIPLFWRPGLRWDRARHFHPSSGWSELQGRGNEGQGPTYTYVL